MMSSSFSRMKSYKNWKDKKRRENQENETKKAQKEGKKKKVNEILRVRLIIQSMILGNCLYFRTAVSIGLFSNDM